MAKFDSMNRCVECGQKIIVDEQGVANHLDLEGEIDYDQDADHTPIPED